MNHVRQIEGCRSILSSAALITLLVCVSSYSQTPVGGVVHGRWTTSGSPYTVVDTCVVPRDSVLTIDPGVTVIVGEGLQLKVFGKISAVGTPNSHIVIRSPNNTIFWNCIYVEFSSADKTSEFAYCDFSNARAAIYLRVNSLNYLSNDTMSTLIQQCSFSYCPEYAILGESHGNAWSIPYGPYCASNPYLNPVIENCRFNFCRTGCGFSIDGAYLYWPYGGITGYGHASPRIENNVFLNLSGSAMPLSIGDYPGDSYPLFINNNVVHCRRGAYAQPPYYAQIENNIFERDSIGVERTGSSTTQVDFNCFHNTLASSFVGFPNSYGQKGMLNRNGDSCDVAFNIFDDPLFTDTTGLPLADLSPCMDAGDSNPAFADACFPPSQGTSLNDIGALGGRGACDWPVQANPAKVVLVTPARGATGIRVSDVLMGWQPSAAAISYRLQIATDSVFVNLVAEDSAIVATSDTVGWLQPMTKYYWRVQAKNAGESSDWSEIWNFTTEDVQGWYDDFESYAIGSMPSTNWAYSGNSEIAIDTVCHVSGNKSIRMFGVLGGCWGALLHREKLVSPPYTIEFWTRNGSEVLSGCHPERADLQLFTGPSWTSSVRILIRFYGNGTVTNGDDSVFAHYATETWIKVKIVYQRPAGSTVRLSYWIDDLFVRTDSLPAFSYEDALEYVSPSLGEGTVWFDDVRVFTGITGVTPEDKVVPDAMVLCQNYPNPFNPSTTIRYTLPRKMHVHLQVYNLLGQNVADLFNGEQQPGMHEAKFDGGGLASGVYFYRIQAGEYVQTRKVLLVR